jgi:hypothetical protein
MTTCLIAYHTQGVGPVPLFFKQCTLIVDGILVTMTMPMTRKHSHHSREELVLEAGLETTCVFMSLKMLMSITHKLRVKQ